MTFGHLDYFGEVPLVRCSARVCACIIATNNMGLLCDRARGIWQRGQAAPGLCNLVARGPLTAEEMDNAVPRQERFLRW